MFAAQNSRYAKLLLMQLFCIVLCCTAFETVWTFDPDKFALTSGDGCFKLVARGKTAVVDGALEINGNGQAPLEASGAALVRIYPELVPAGRFGVDVTFRAGECENQYQYIIDSQYNWNAKEKNGGFCLFLQKHSGRWMPVLSIGLGNGAYQFKSALPKVLESGKEYKLSVMYDGTGRVSFCWDDGESETVAAPRPVGPVCDSGYPIVIGDHYRANYQPLHGAVTSFRLRIFSPAIERRGPGAFHSFSGKRRLSFVLSNDDEDWDNVVGTLTVPPLAPMIAESGHVASGKTVEHVFDIDTRLLPGVYQGNYSFVSSTGIRESIPVNFSIGPSEDRHRFPVVIWNHGNYQCDEVYVPYGVTHTMKWLSAAPDTAKLDEFKQGLDRAVTLGISVFDQFLPPWGSDLKYYRLNRGGERYKLKGIDFRHPEIVKWMNRYAERVLDNFGEYPAWVGSLILTEQRDSTNPSYSGYEQAAFRKYSGRDVPEDINSRIHYDPWKIDGAFSRGIVDYRHPVLEYYRWFWSDGDGYSPVTASVSEQLRKGRKNFRPDFFTVSDPAVRVPPVWGNGAGADALHHWTYTYFTPPKIVKVADELAAMGNNDRGRQGIFTSAQGIWYRKWVAPVEETVSAPPEWTRQKGAEKYTLVTIPPDILEEALYLQLMRPVKGIMMYDYGCVFGTHGYKVTNWETRERFKKVVHRAVKPLGPVLACIPAPKAEIAMLQSFPAAVLAGRGEYGWGDGWETRMHVALQFAGYPVDVLYEDHVRRDGLEGFKVLLMPHCDVLSKDIAESIYRFQARGGIVVADEFCPPAIVPDIVVFSQCGSWPDEITSTDPVRVDREIKELSAELAEKLKSFVEPECSFSVSGVSICVRKSGDGVCMIAVNDNRTFGEYIGQYGRMCEKHVPVKGMATVNGMRAAVVCDMERSLEVPFSTVDGKTQIPVDFTGGPGRIFMLLPERIDYPEIRTSGDAMPGQEVKVTVRIVGDSGRTVKAAIPVRISVFKPDGTAADAPEHLAAVDGIANFSIPVPLNAPDGKWSIELKELCSGRKGRSTFMVK